MKLIEKITLNDVYLFLESGNPNDAPIEIVTYLEVLSEIRGMIQRIDKFGTDRIVINHLVLTHKFSEYQAKNLLEEAREYFWADSKVSIDSWKNFYAELMDQEIAFMRLVKKDTADSKRIIEACEKAYALRGGNDEEKQEYPAEFFQKPWVVYTTDVEALGLPKVNRNRIKEFIDNKVPELTEKERNRLYQEADIIPFKALQNDEENPRKN